MDRNGNCPGNAGEATEPKSTASRREYLGGIAGIVGMGLNTSEIRKRTKIVVTKDPDGPVRRERVPYEWENHRETVKKSLNELRKRYASNENVISVYRTQGMSQIGTHSRFKIKVEITSPSPEIPDRINDIPVETTPPSNYQPLASTGCVNEGDWDLIPGGVHISQYSDATNYGTTYATCNIVNSQYDSVMVTANHVMYSDSCSATGADAFQETDKVGSVAKSYNNYDCAAIDFCGCTGDDGYTDDFVDGIKDGDNGVNKQIAAWYTDSGLDHLISTGETVRKIGVSSGLTKGQVEDRPTLYGACWQLEDCVKVSARSAEGDSGGPCYTLNDNDECVLVSMINIGLQEDGTECGHTGFDVFGGIPQIKLDQALGVEPHVS